MRMLEEVEVSPMHFGVPRVTAGVPCPKCGGYAPEDRSQPTTAEIEAYDCGRGRACCTRAFVCNLCAYSFIVRIDPPECGW